MEILTDQEIALVSGGTAWSSAGSLSRAVAEASITAASSQRASELSNVIQSL